MHTPDFRRLAAVLALSAVLGACSSSSGGDDDAGPVPPPNAGTDLPSAARDSVAGLISYMRELTATSSDSTEPVRVGNADLPVSDTTEAAPVN